MHWSIASPLSREFIPFELPSTEAVSDIARAQFEIFSDLRLRILAKRGADGRRRAELQNRSRSQRTFELGDIVLWKDPKDGKHISGHGPGKRPLRGPFRVTRLEGHRAWLFDPTTKTTLPRIHADNLIGCPGLTSLDDAEDSLQTRPPFDVLPDADGDRPSLSRLLLEKRERRASGKPLVASDIISKRTQDVKPGRFILYIVDEHLKHIGLGKVLNVSTPPTEATVHVYLPAKEHQFQTSWQPQFSNIGASGYVNQTIETVPFSRILGTTERSEKGVILHSDATRLAKKDWRMRPSAEPTVSSVQHQVVPSTSLSDGPTHRVAQIVAAFPRFDDDDAALRYRTDILRWAHGMPAWIELFDGKRGLSKAMISGQWPVVPGIDIKRATYGIYWDLSKPADRHRLRFLLLRVIKPGGVHAALPCSPWSALGKH